MPGSPVTLHSQSSGSPISSGPSCRPYSTFSLLLQPSSPSLLRAGGLGRCQTAEVCAGPPASPPGYNWGEGHAPQTMRGNSKNSQAALVSFGDETCSAQYSAFPLRPEVSLRGTPNWFCGSPGKQFILAVLIQVLF